MKRWRSGSNLIVFAPDGHTAVCGEGADIRIWDINGVDQYQASWALSQPQTSLASLQNAQIVSERIEQAQQALSTNNVVVAAEALKTARSLPGFERDTELKQLWNEIGSKAGKRQGLLSSRCQFSELTSSASINAAQFSSDESKLLICGQEDSIQWWDLGTFECIRQYLSPTCINTAMILPDEGAFLIAGDLKRLI